MTDTQWVRIGNRRSWHIFRTFTRGGSVRTLCNRDVGLMDSPPQLVDVRPSGKTCELCFRKQSRELDG